MKTIENDYEDQYFDRIMDMIYDDSICIGYSLNDKEKALEIVRALRSVANEIEKPFRETKKVSSAKDYNPNDPVNW